MSFETESSLQNITLGPRHEYLPIERKSIFQVDGSFKQSKSISAYEIRYKHSESTVIEEIRVNGTGV